MIKNNSDFIFLFDVTNSNPNGDPDNENRPRMDGDTKTLLVSDVRRKRDIRDFLANKGYEIFVGTLNDEKVTMEKRFDEFLNQYGLKKDADGEEKVNAILDNMIDIRLFGSAMAVGGITKTYTGPVQMTWGYSLHPTDISKSSTIVSIMNDKNSTFGKMYKAHYSLVAHSGTINKYAASKTHMTEEDKTVFSSALIQSMMNNLTHSKQGQQPILYLEVKYTEDFDGYIGDLRRFINAQWPETGIIRSIKDLSVDFEPLCKVIEDMRAKGYIEDVAGWTGYGADAFMNMPDFRPLDLLAPLKK